MRFTRKIITLLLVLALLSLMSITLYAAEATVTATVVATNTPTYTVIVPPELSATDLQRTETSVYYQKEFIVSVPEVSFLNGKQIEVRVWGGNGVFALTNADGNSILPYEVFSNVNTDLSLQNGEIFATFTEPGEASGFVRIDQKNITRADTYTGNLMFSFSVSDLTE